MITPEGRTKVLDFGIARRLSSHDAHDITRSRDPLSADGVIAGTLAYMAPEVLRGEPADPRSDIWALGVLLQEMAAGERPFKGQTRFDLSSAILRDSPAALPQRVPATLGRIVQRCLAKDPEERYQRASEVRAVLEISQPERSLSDLRVDVEPVEVQRPPMTTGRPRRSLAWILAASLACLALGIGSWVVGRGLRFWSAPLDARTILILPLEVRGQNDGGDYVGRAFAEALAMHLARTKDLHVLPVPQAGELARAARFRV
jgi:serine/threonine protein kinase